MSLSLQRSERLASLRGQLAAMGAPARLTLAEGQSGSPIPLGPKLGPKPTAFAPLLSAGQAFGGLHEIVAAGAGDRACAAGFALDFMAACSRLWPRRGVVLVVEDFVCWEHGAPYGPGLVEAGVDAAVLLLVRTGSTAETLAATESALRSPAVAGVLVESAISPRHYDLATSRRLLLAARAGGSAALLLPLAFAGQGERLSSAATTRFEIARARSRAQPFGRALPMPGRPAFSFRMLKSPGGLTDEAARARDRWRTGVFGVSTSEAAFHAFSVHPSPVPADRPHPSPGERGGEGGVTSASWATPASDGREPVRHVA